MSTAGSTAPAGARRFDGKIALITGSSRGIGRALALTLAAEGATLVINYKKNAEAAADVVRQIEALGSKAIAVQADVENPADIDRLFQVVGEEFGRLDIFVANAAAAAFKNVLDFNVNNLDRTWNMNVRSFVLGAQRAVPLMQDGGKIVAITSYGSQRAFMTYAALGSAKAAIESWVRYMANEFGPRGITVNAVNGGLIDTDSLAFFYGVPGNPPIDSVLAKVPLRRPGTAQEMADTAAFLLSPAGGYITGQVIVVDGGLTISSPPYATDAIVVAPTAPESAAPEASGPGLESGA